jgi:hypothetical protein
VGPEVLPVANLLSQPCHMSLQAVKDDLRPVLLGLLAELSFGNAPADLARIHRPERREVINIFICYVYICSVYICYSFAL